VLVWVERRPVKQSPQGKMRDDKQRPRSPPTVARVHIPTVATAYIGVGRDDGQRPRSPPTVARAFIGVGAAGREKGKEAGWGDGDRSGGRASGQVGGPAMRRDWWSRRTVVFPLQMPSQ